MAEPCYLGVDLGGTQLRMAAVTGEGRLATSVHSVPTGKDFGPEDLARELRRLNERVRAVVSGRDIPALGFGTAGVVHEGPLAQSDNLPRLNGVDIAPLVEAAAGCPVSVENDARCFTLAETRFGAGRGSRHLCGITLGTGVGCGLMIGGQLHRGAASQAGEVWRIPVRGRPIEYYLSGAGIVRGYEAAGGPHGLGRDAKRVAERAREGDEAARAAWRAFGEDLYTLCECAASLVDPEVIVVGGSLSKARDLFGADLEARFSGRSTRIAWAELGPAAGVIGAAALNI